MSSRILIVDPDATARAVSEQALTAANIEVVGSVGSGEQALAVARSAQPTIALIDVGVDGMSADTTARRLRDLLGYRLDVIAQMSFSNVDKVVEMVATGTAAFIVKGKLDDLVAAVRAVSSGSGMLSTEASRPLLEEIQRRYEAEMERNHELEATVARLEAVSITDWLTGLKNHGFFWERLVEELERARRYDRPLAVVMADIDDFKAVNDAYGHSVGDEVLRAVGGAIISSVRESDIPCRVGGEEFALIIPETDIDGAMRAAERVRVAVSQLALPTVGSVAVSLGVAVHPYHAANGTALVEAADRALYEAKHAGKNCTRLVGGDVHAIELIGSMGPVVSALLAALGLKAPRLVVRSRKVADLAVQLGVQMGLSVVDLERLRVAALLHDVGVLGVAESILMKPGSLTETETEAVREHPVHGYNLVVEATRPEIADAVRAHHEAFDGTGYPDGLAGHAIPLFGRIIHVADVVEAMKADRPDRPAQTTEATLSEIARGAGTEFDPEVAAALIGLLGDESESDGAEVIDFPASGTTA